MEYVAIFIGGGVGSLIRFAISKGLGSSQTGFPTGTFVANILACLVLGLAWNYFAQRVDITDAYKSLVLVGFCGGFSTFSTFSFETLRLLQAGQWGLAMLYVVLSVACCVALLALVYRP